MTDQLGAARLSPAPPISRRQSPRLIDAAMAVAGPGPAAGVGPALDTETAGSRRAPGGRATFLGQFRTLTGARAPALQPVPGRLRG